MNIRRLLKPAKRENSMDLHIDVTFRPIMPGGEVDIEDQQERVQESLSISVPPARVPKPNPALLNYRGQRVRLLLRDGVKVVGNPDRTQWDFFRLTNVQETGADYELTADWIAIRDETIARIYPADAKIQKTDGK